MKKIVTKYGVIKGIISINYYDNNVIEECKVEEYCEIVTAVGTLVPQYEDDGLRRKYTKSLSFYKNGNIKTISLQKQTDIKTSIGKVPAEFISFYENGRIKRILSLNGKITGFWTEENECDLAIKTELSFKFGKFTKKIMGIKFYESGEVKSLTFWTSERINIQTPCGMLDIRMGISLYEDGKIKSCEPSIPVKVNTPIGDIMAYDLNAVGINGDENSLNFYEDGKIKSLVTSIDEIKVMDSNGRVSSFQPGSKLSSYNDEGTDIVPLIIEFYRDKIKFNKDENCEFVLGDNSFFIENSMQQFNLGCNSCEGCNKNCVSS